MGLARVRSFFPQVGVLLIVGCAPRGVEPGPSSSAAVADPPQQEWADSDSMSAPLSQVCAPRPTPVPKMNGTFGTFLTQACTLPPCDPATRFDDCVRDDAFAAYSGDADALDRFWCRLEVHLEHDRDHAQALSWRGGLYLYLSGFAFRASDFTQGQHLENMGYADLERSIELAPNDLGVRIQHMITLANTVRWTRGAQKIMAIEQAQRDLDVRMHLTPKPFSDHARGEVWAIRVQLQKARVDTAARAFVEQQRDKLVELLSDMAADTKGTVYAQAAECWSAGFFAAPIGCHGCHETSRSHLPK